MTAPLPGGSAGAAWSLGRLPRIVFGPGRIADLPATVLRHGRRVLLVTGGRAFDADGRGAAIVAALTAAGAEVAGRVIVASEPGPDAIDAAVARHRGDAIDVVVAIGGGSAIDAGKAVAGLLRTGTSIRDHVEGLPGARPWPGPAVPVIAVPTTAGTGSEATRNAVVTERGPNGWKRSFRDEALVPADAIVDPDLLAGAPPALIAANGLDALTQLLEPLVCTRATPVTDALALAGLARARDGLLPWFRDPDGPGAPAARAAMAEAALLSGICLANAGLGAVHGFAAALGALRPIAHGEACGVVLAPVTERTIAALAARAPGSPARARYAAAGRILAALPPGTDDGEACAALVATLHAWVAELGVRPLAAHGVGAAEIPAIAAAAQAASSMKPHPVALTDAELGAILRDAGAGAA